MFKFLAFEMGTVHVLRIVQCTTTKFSSIYKINCFLSEKYNYCKLPAISSVNFERHRIQWSTLLVRMWYWSCSFWNKKKKLPCQKVTRVITVFLSGSPKITFGLKDNSVLQITGTFIPNVALFDLTRTNLKHYVAIWIGLRNQKICTFFNFRQTKWDA